jgi:hypothetical protein
MQKWRLPIIIGIAVGALVGGGFFIKTKYFSPVVSSTSQESNTDSTQGAKQVVWEDPAGFTFSYPEGLTVNPHPEDKENYAHIEFADPAHPGYIIVWAKDLPAGGKTLAAWVKANKSYAAATLVDSTFVGEPAKKILLATTPPSRHLVSYADDLLFIIETSLEDAEFWSPIADGIVDTFKITPPEKTTSAGAASTSDYVAADEEETIE